MINELKEEIRKTILKVCDDHKISEYSVSYKLDIVITLDVEDKITKQEDGFISIPTDK